MAKSGLFTGVDIGTNTIKVLVAEYIRGDMNIIGVGNAKSEGLKNGIIVDIDKVATSLRKAVEAAEERSGIKITNVNVGLPANMLEVDPCQGMIPISNESKEITDNDVDQVVDNALLRSVLPEREIIAVVPKEFTVDGFEGITDPRGMFGVRLEMKGLLYTGPKTIIHNLRKAVERAGLVVENIVITPLSLSKYVLNEGEREFGTVIVDMGAGHTSTIAMKDQELQQIDVSSEGGDYATKDVSTVLNTSIEIAEDLKINYGEASTERASKDERFLVDVVGKNEPEAIDEYYLAQILEARLTQIFTHVKHELEQSRTIDYPGGIVLIGGGAAMPGIVELASQVLGVNVRLFVPAEMGLRNPIFANVLSIVNYVGSRSDIETLVQNAVVKLESPAESIHSQNSQSTEYTNFIPVSREEDVVVSSNVAALAPEQVNQDNRKEGGVFHRVRDMFGNMFD
ncbi:cell division protein FtsA [Floricoccus penangensis]|uniref:Cell division protein FtsA n=1 Tax=Floricoccus penangensis TaxID=1859475 RepID=A0A9Q5JFE7_9LACT|nr:cell division protein FtsA [Floricoccus penangensis]OFI46315.1 cell division protein FtsA [Floricoccus penangensis]URZ87041.1 cell division protein FtsA [Floricoccus penangensis]